LKLSLQRERHAGCKQEKGGRQQDGGRLYDDAKVDLTPIKVIPFPFAISVHNGIIFTIGIVGLPTSPVRVGNRFA